MECEGRCMTKKKIYVTPKVQHWHAEELDQIVAQMSGGGGETPPLLVTMECPCPTVYGCPPTFIATVNVPATMTFFLDGVCMKSETGMRASFTPDPFVPVGKHEVKVIATIGDEKSEATCEWEVEPELEVAMECPEPTCY
jgi:hypothetical protein